MDAQHITAADVGNNFFVSEEFIGQPRAKVTCQLLNELNEFVEGHFFVEDPVLLIRNKPEFFDHVSEKTCVKSFDLNFEVLDLNQISSS